MSSGGKYTSKDYLALGLAILLAFGVWFIHNLSLNYSSLVSCSFEAKCGIEGHSDLSSSPVEVTARCEMTGFGLVSNYLSGSDKVITVNVAPEDMHHSVDDYFYMTKADLTRYVYDFFGDKAKLEYFITDTVYFRFTSVNYKKVPVKMVTVFDFRSQYMALGEPRLQPDSVTIYGNEEHLSAISSVLTQVVRASDISSDVVGEAGIEEISGIRMSDTKVQYSLPVARYVELDLKVPVVMENVPKDSYVQIFPSTATIHLRSVYPGSDKTSDVRVALSFDDFEHSISGKCLGTVEGIPDRTISYTLEPEVFDCMLKSR